MESLSDSVNGGEKMVGALMLDDSGQMEKRPQMDKVKPIIPFPFDHWPEGRRRKKRDDRRKSSIYAFIAISLFVVCATSAAVALNIHNLNPTLHNILIVTSFIFGVITLIALIVSTILLLRSCNDSAGTGTGLEMTNQ